jgi:two-component system, LuxR family, sensor kinase FixL
MADRTEYPPHALSGDALAHARLPAILNTVVDGIITIDEQGTVLSFNPAAERIFGYPAEQVIGRNIKMLMPEPYHSEHDEYLANYLRTGIKKIIGIGREVRGLRQDGIIFPMDLAVSETRFGDERLFTGIVRDVSERHHAAQERERLISELEHKNAEMERFTYTVSHDLKSPLITIRGFLGLLEKDVAAGDDERMRSDMAHIHQAVQKMQQMLDELLSLSRIGRLDNPTQPVPLAELAHEAALLVAGRIRQNGVRVEIADDLPVVIGDRPRLLEVLLNLLDNAVKFTGAQPQPLVRIGWRLEQGEEVIFVQDNGIGIDPDYQERVFALFERLDPASDGTGIGLTLVKRIVQVHGGRIWIESAGTGHGSTFCFTLPGKKDAS